MSYYRRASRGGLALFMLINVEISTILYILSSKRFKKLRYMFVCLKSVLKAKKEPPIKVTLTVKLISL